MIKLYGNPMSTCTRKVLCTLHETNTPHEFVVVDFAKGEHKQPAHTARQPFGQVPAIDDDGFAMYESRAIARYIDWKSGGKLTPTDIKQRGKMEQWISVETENFTPNAMKFVYEHIFKRPQGEEVMKNATQKLELACSVLDKNLAGKSFLVGDQFTIADITYAPYIEYAMNTPAKEIFAKHPNVMAWWGRVHERPSWMKAAGRA
ncbi:MAG TPA: glutathione binding-like protein [Kofleriaceae bacterium]|jgi:glutathione S-transferase